MNSFNEYLTEAFIDPFATASVHVAGPNGVKGKWNVWVNFDTLKAGEGEQSKLIKSGMSRTEAKKLRLKLNSSPAAMKKALGGKVISATDNA